MGKQKMAKFRSAVENLEFSSAHFPKVEQKHVYNKFIRGYAARGIDGQPSENISGFQADKVTAQLPIEELTASPQVDPGKMRKVLLRNQEDEYEIPNPSLYVTKVINPEKELQKKIMSKELNLSLIHI
eukprot:TRINITY_DN52089_c0_g1_i1.p3 TRINITY_DN52089_c0_g1~~TRINITY_DN52089_c0_g1_i1.p3  ORF type:complete len:128 (+),score=23.98 TRINITY_DN52089_c0_g1_i1:219-602(+)